MGESSKHGQIRANMGQSEQVWQIRTKMGKSEQKWANQSKIWPKLICVKTGSNFNAFTPVL